MRSVFRNTTFRRLFFGRLVTNAGDSLYYIAAMWLVHDVGGSAFYTGFAGFLMLVPQALQFLTGPFVDHWNLRRLLVGTQAVQGVLVLVVPLAAMTGWLSITVVLVVMPVASMVNQFVYPAQNAALPRIVADENVSDANSAFSFAYQGTDTVFSSFGGVLVALVGAVSLYLIDTVTFAIAASVFAATRIPAVEEGEEETERVASVFADYTEQLHEGVAYVRGTIITLILAGWMVVNFTIGATIAVLPAFADLRGGPETYGVLFAAMTAGLLIGALGATQLQRVSLGRVTVIGFVVSSLTWFTAVSTQWLPATAVLFCVSWIPVGVTNVVFMTMIQTVVPEDLLGRVISLETSVGAAAKPVGSLVGGIAGDVFGSTVVVAAMGVGFLFVALYWFSHPSLRGLPAVEKIDPTVYDLKSA